LGFFFAVLPAMSQVAIFSQPGFPYYGGNSMVSPVRIQSWLKEYHIESVLINAKQLSSPSELNALRYKLLIYPYGNTFPLEAAANLRAFHLAGGSIMAPGIPFCHPCVQVNGQWQDQGHQPQWFDDDHIGFGGFNESPAGAKKLVHSGLDPLHLGYLQLSQLDANSQFPTPPVTADRKLIPVIEEEVNGIAAGAPAAIIEHTSGPFRGAYDIWAGCEALNSPTPAAVIDTQQFMVSATAWILKQKGMLSPTRLSQVQLALKRGYHAPPIYANLNPVTIPKSYPGVFPKPGTPDKHLWVVDARHMNAEQQLTLVSLQGIVNRTHPRIYVIWGEWDQFWLDWMQKGGFTETPHLNAKLPNLIKRYRSELKGVIVNDPHLFIGQDVAAMLASVHNAIIVAPTQSHYGLPIAFDMRNRWKTNAQAMDWCFQNLRTQLDPHQLCCIYPGQGTTKVLDYCISSRMIVFWITGAVDGVRPGCDPIAETAVIEKLFARLPVNIPVRGFWYAGTDVGIQEGPGVTLGSRFAKFTVCSDLIGDVSVHAGTRVSDFHQVQAPAPPLDGTKNYLAFIMSDGDNQCTFYDFFPNYWKDPEHGKVPIGWSVGPTAVDTMPDIMAWYYRNATPADDFICAVSGVGYMYPDDYARSYKDRTAVYNQFIRMTADYMKKLDLNVLWLMGIQSNQLLTDYATQIPGLKAIFPDYGHGPGMTYQKADYYLGPHIPIFHAMTSGGGSTREESIKALADQVRQAVVNTPPPTFLHVFVMNWTYNPSMLAQVLQELGPDYVAVTPNQLATLYNEERNGN
jgi:hypothetical protein